jgi:hypothetical protein
MGRHVLTVFGYFLATFATQATSHFAINAEHYEALAYLRKDPIFPLGILSMLIQGSVLSYLYSRTIERGGSFGQSLTFSWLAGAILVSYIALGEPAKYTVPSIASWIAVELAAGFVQFTLFGLVLGFVHRAPSRATVTELPQKV